MPSTRRILQHSVVKYGVASLLPRTLSVVAMLLLTPMALNALGAAEYGVWVLAIQLPNLVISPDLGLTYGLVNEVSTHLRSGGTITSLRARLDGLRKVLGGVAFAWLIAGSLAAFAYSFWVASDAGGPQPLQVFTALGLSLICFTVGIPATIWPRAQLAEERGHVALQWEGIGKLGSLVACSVVLLTFPSLPLLVVAFVLPPSLALWGNAWRSRSKYFSGSDSGTPSLKWRQAAQENRSTFSLGRFFVLMQVAFLLGTALDPYLVSGFLNATSVAEWSVLRRPFDVLPLAIGMFSTALWPVFNRLNARGQVRQARRTFYALLASAAVLTACLGSAVVFFRDAIYGYLSGDTMQAPVSTLLWLVTAASVTGCMLIINNYLNAVDLVRVQALALLAGTSLLLASKSIALWQGDLHTYFVVNGLGLLLLQALPLLVIAIRHLHSRAPSMIGS